MLFIIIRHCTIMSAIDFCGTTQHKDNHSDILLQICAATHVIVLSKSVLFYVHKHAIIHIRQSQLPQCESRGNMFSRHNHNINHRLQSQIE